jgi:hypothetical protein
LFPIPRLPPPNRFNPIWQPRNTPELHIWRQRAFATSDLAAEHEMRRKMRWSGINPGTGSKETAGVFREPVGLGPMPEIFRKPVVEKPIVDAEKLLELKQRKKEEMERLKKEETKEIVRIIAADGRAGFLESKASALWKRISALDREITKREDSVRLLIEEGSGVLEGKRKRTAELEGLEKSYQTVRGDEMVMYALGEATFVFEVIKASDDSVRIYLDSLQWRKGIFVEKMLRLGTELKIGTNPLNGKDEPNLRKVLKIMIKVEIPDLKVKRKSNPARSIIDGLVVGKPGTNGFIKEYPDPDYLRRAVVDRIARVLGESDLRVSDEEERTLKNRWFGAFYERRKRNLLWRKATGAITGELEAWKPPERGELETMREKIETLGNEVQGLWDKENSIGASIELERGGIEKAGRSIRELERERDKINSVLRRNSKVPSLLKRIFGTDDTDEIVGKIDSMGDVGKEWEALRERLTDEELARVEKTCPELRQSIFNVNMEILRANEGRFPFSRGLK